MGGDFGCCVQVTCFVVDDSGWVLVVSSSENRSSDASGVDACFGSLPSLLSKNEALDTSPVAQLRSFCRPVVLLSLSSWIGLGSALLISGEPSRRLLLACGEDVILKS